MDYDGLTREYWDNQRQRVEEVRARINGRSQAAPGRIVPEDESLAIGEGRRLQMAVMFLDISGFSQRPSETPAEQDMLLRVLNLFFSEMIRVAEEYGGTVEKNTGDGLMAYFEDNAGDPPETGTKRAVACALTMMAANQHLIRCHHRPRWAPRSPESPGPRAPLVGFSAVLRPSRQRMRAAQG